MTTALSAFRVEVLMEVAGAPTPLIDREIRHAAIDFCDYTLTWRTPVDLQDIIVSTSDYDLTVPSDARVVTVLYAGRDGVRMLPTSERRLDDEQDGWRNSTTTAAGSSWYYLPDRETIRIALTPDASATDALAVMCAFKPTQTATNLPDILFDDHLEAIGHGAKARLLAIPGKPWSNPQLAAYHEAKFEKAKKKEKAERLNDYTRQSTLSIGCGAIYN